MGLTELIDLKVLATRESEQVEWKENVADVDDVVATLSAFANDWAKLGGGYVVCGAKEERDEHGFPRLAVVGLTAAGIASPHRLPHWLKSYPPIPLSGAC